jgi:hypothetical protein
MPTKPKSDNPNPTRTKKDLQEMLAEAVRNTEPKPKPKAPRKGRKKWA